MRPSLSLSSLSSTPPPLRETMVVTKTYCELLYVEADNIRKIYEVSLFLHLPPFHLLYLSQTHKDVMENLLHPRGGECSGKCGY